MEKTVLYQLIDQYQSVITNLSDQIWDFAELSMQETNSANTYIQLLRQYGFSVETNLAGLPTAFSGSYGSGHPRIGILGEFDALSGLSQKSCCAEKTPAAGVVTGHGCGHNLLGAASFGACLALKECIQDGQLPGTIVFYGCPGEEGCAGKTFMARDGLFQDLDAALCWHPGDVNEVTTGSNAASLQLKYHFTGISAHAAGDPENGRSALDACELMNIGVQYLREHMPKVSSVHYAYTNAGGISPNVVQEEAELVYMVRSDTVQNAKQLLKRVNQIAQGAAMMTQTKVTVTQIDGTANTLSNHVIEQLLYENLCKAPLPHYTQEELTFAQQLKATCPAGNLPGQRTKSDVELYRYMKQTTENGALPLNNFIVPYAPSLCINPGSTDVGDVSWLTPTAQFTAVTWVSNSPGHSWQNVSIGKHSIAHKGMLFAAKVLAATAADLMENRTDLENATAEFLEFSADGYDCPIGNDVNAII